MFEWSKQAILLTGGTGSFGQAFTKTLLKKHTPRIIRIYSRDEYKQYLMQEDISHKNLRYFIGDVRDQERLKRAMNGVTLVVHAAAMKQIVAAEYNPTEAVKTNIIGSMNVLNAALDAGVERVFGLITDKAVSPVNLYGGTKLVMEKLLVQGNAYVGKGKTRISAVRYGNVAGSRGSIIPLFLKQKKRNELTVTHPEMTRFWMTLDEGVTFVIKCIERMQGGEVFVPKLPSFRVLDLCNVVSPNAKIRYIGIRPGEKIHEDLITHHESRNVREYSDRFEVLPEQNFHNSNVKKVKKGRPVPEHFSYNSNHNSHFLTKKELESRTKSIVEIINNEKAK